MVQRLEGQTFMRWKKQWLLQFDFTQIGIYIKPVHITATT